jgi:hypothetical protein
VDQDRHRERPLPIGQRQLAELIPALAIRIPARFDGYVNATWSRNCMFWPLLVASTKVVCWLG